MLQHSASMRLPTTLLLFSVRLSCSASPVLFPSSSSSSSSVSWYPVLHPQTMTVIWILTRRARLRRRRLLSYFLVTAVVLTLFLQNRTINSSPAGPRDGTYASNLYAFSNKVSAHLQRSCHQILGCDKPADASLTTTSSSLVPSPTPVVISKEEQRKINEKKARWENFAAQYRRNRELHFDPNPLKQLAYCSSKQKKPGVHSNFLTNAVTDEGTMARVEFLWGDRTPRYNPNILPYPPGSKLPYLGIARISPLRSLYHHELVWCDLKWIQSRTIGRTMLECDGRAKTIQFEKEWPTPPGLCKTIPFLSLMQGHTDPRVFFSPRGEPLMVVGTNGRHNCLHQYVIDLRAVIPDLGAKMKLENVPVRYKKLTELTRPVLSEVEKNWFVMYDEKNVGWIQHDTNRRTVSLLDPPPAKKKGALPEVVNIGNKTPKVVTSLIQTFKDKRTSANDLHQASNTLRVTLCDFPCIPTIHNTVIVEILHVKYKNFYELFYRRFAVIMNATAPFDIIGRTGSLHYAGVDEKTMVYTVSMIWDSQHYARHEPWDEKKHGGQEVWRVLNERDRINDEKWQKKMEDRDRRLKQEKEEKRKQLMREKQADETVEQERLQSERTHMVKQEEDELESERAASKKADDKAEADEDSGSWARRMRSGIEKLAELQVRFGNGANFFQAFASEDSVSSTTAISTKTQAPVLSTTTSQTADAKATIKKREVPNTLTTLVTTTTPSTDIPKATTTPSTTPAKKEQPQPALVQNPFVNPYYHGWLNDVLMINFGINDAEAGFLHVTARDLLDCILVNEG
ncbi:hypothetical protein BZA70DRAFT_278526 [Myxozyma melibiosi]|uniref:Uncharacterized protein n=1 Tax=Myxozyma melibiosi TaxID=54550 RepID=A0ABR1F6X6_9ASCO